jgi:hypothetical protein
MNIKMIALFVALTSMLIACSPAEASLSNARTARDPEGTSTTNAFSETDTFYVVTDLSNAPRGTIVRAVWSGINPSGGAELINEGSQTTEENNFKGAIFFELGTDGRWPTGEYQVELFLNDTLVETLSFKVE